jgi:hypothetical protein
MKWAEYVAHLRNEKCVENFSQLSIVTRQRAGRPGFDSREGYGVFSSPPHPVWLWGPPSLLSSGYPEPFLRGVKLTTHFLLVPSFRTRGTVPPLSHYVFMVWCLVKHRNNYILPLPEGKRPLWRPRRKWEKIVKSVLKK